MEMELQRLDKLLASQSPYSRKQAKAVIRAGRVLVNGSPAVSGEQKVGYGDSVVLDGVPLRSQKNVYVMMNKPAGTLCATRDPHCRTVLDILPPDLRRRGLFPAGRLDKDSEGFVLLTDDGAFAHRILSPRSHVPKTYQVRLNAPFDIADLQFKFSNGLCLDGGDLCSPAELVLLEGGESPLVQVTIYEGMHHQIKRMFRQFSLDVLHLRRVQIGGLSLDPSLPLGGAREILHKELEKICGTFGEGNDANLNSGPRTVEMS